MIGAKVVRHARSVIFQIAGLAVLWEKSELILRGGQLPVIMERVEG